MSHFLWVEDFEGDTLKSATEAVFGEWLQNKTLPDTKTGIKKLLKKHRVFVEFSFLSGLQFIRDPNQLLSVDYIILDINLEIVSPLDLDDDEEDNERLINILQEYYDYDPQLTDDIAKQQSFDKAKDRLIPKAGYQLYTELVIELGFPKDHILFCSNHAQEQKSIQADFKQAAIDLPQLLSKDQKADIQAWIRQRRKNPYSVLRRGILNVLDHVEKEIGQKNLKLTLPFAEEADPVNADTFLKGVKFLVKDELKEPNKEEQRHLFLTLCDTLTKPFERFTRELFNGRYKGENLNRIQMDQAFIIPAYFIRNWLAHGLFNQSQTELSVQDIGFIFILVIKSLFNYSGFEAFKSLYSASTLADQDVVRLLSELHEYYSTPEKCDIFEQIRASGEKKSNKNWQQEHFMAHIYASFLFNCMNSVRVSPPDDKKTRTQLLHNKRGYYFNLKYLFIAKEELFEQLKPIAYQRLQQLKQHLPR